MFNGNFQPYSTVSRLIKIILFSNNLPIIYCNQYEQEYTISVIYSRKKTISTVRLSSKISPHLDYLFLRSRNSSKNGMITTHLKQIVTFIVHPHLVGWMLLGTLALACVENLRRRAPGQLDREGPLQEQQASGGPRAPWVRPVSQDRGHFSGPVANVSKRSAAVASRGLENKKERQIYFIPSLHF